MKEIFAVMNTTKAVVKIRPEKNIQACTGFEPVTSAILLQRSTNWSNKLVSSVANIVSTCSIPLCWPREKKNAVNYAYGFSVLDCIPIVTQHKKSVPKKWSQFITD